MLDGCIANAVACHILLTKADKLSNNDARRQLLSVKQWLHQRPACSVQLFSALKKQGLAELTQTLTAWLQIAADPQPPPA